MDKKWWIVSIASIIISLVSFLLYIIYDFPFLFLFLFLPFVFGIRGLETTKQGYPRNYCKVCGIELQPNSNFCPSCGNLID
jgi:hypothetical protein